MFRKIKKLLGMVPSPEKWDELKSQGLELVLGKEHNMVMHALIPFEIGGALDLYYFPRPDGFGIATKELIDEFGSGPKNRLFNGYEICAFSCVKFDLDSAKDDGSAMGKIHSRLNGILNAMARYSFHASLNPNETMEFPPNFSDELGGQCLILDEYRPSDKEFKINGKRFGLMVVINIFRDEMEYARKEGGGNLIKKLKENGHYPFSDLNRKSVLI